MKHTTTSTVALLVATALLFVFTSVAHAEETTCTGTLGAVTVDNLRVAPDTTCTLTGTKVQGTVKVESNARLIASGIQVIGNIQAEGAAEVRVGSNSKVGGSIQIKQGGSADIANTAVTADIQFESNRGALRAANNNVGGNIQIVQNTGGASVTDNVIDGNLQCKENVPAPTGSGNVVKGSAEDQCANLTGGGGGGGGGGSSTCSATLGAVTVENLTVAQGATCILKGTKVQGTVTVESNARLIASGIQVIGNIQADGAAEVLVSDSSRVGGSIQIKQGGSAGIDRVTVTGDIQFESNRGSQYASNNQVGGNIQIMQNTGGVSVASNVVDGNLQCKQNVPVPAGGGNVVKGSAEDQCANLTGGSPSVIGPNPAYLPVIRR